MAETVVVKEALTREMIEAGAELTRQLDEAQLGARAVLWLYLSEYNTWRLFIALPKLNEEGPRKMYKKIQSVLAKLPGHQPQIDLSDISLLDTHDPFVTHLRSLVKPGPSISGARVSDSFANGHSIDEAYVYRSA